MSTIVSTKYTLSISAPGHMDEPPEATTITVDGHEDVAKRVFAGELRLTAAAVGETADGEVAATDLLAHPLPLAPFGVRFGQWECVMTAEPYVEA